jgi:phage terminase small subunit
VNVTNPEKTEHDESGPEWGQLMSALTAKQRGFVVALYDVRPGRGIATRAARKAGYGGTPGSTRMAAFRLMHSEKIQAAISEFATALMPRMGLRAVRALSNLIEDASHRDHARAVGMALDRTQPLTLKIDHTVRTQPPVNEAH